ncbi:MAG: SDR family NAD(P)-dependent oxidoreductase [Actinomycetales bacterium]|nr:SDR family NAD(P)-dependent oxidoreductase [Actinomycetales bacterium]
MAWTVAAVPDQTGRTFVVTGANTGLGLEVTSVLVRRGARVIMACRNLAKGAAARERLLDDRSLDPAGLDLREVDVASLASVRAFVAGLAGERIDVLVNNAGIMATPQAVSADGHEVQFATNVLGPFALTIGLLPQIADRVVWVSSNAHRLGGLQLDDPSFRHRRYNPWRAYGASKLADLLLAYEMQRRLTLAGSAVRSYAAHPGYSLTELARHQRFSSLPGLGALQRTLRIAQPAAAGAWPLLMAATDPSLPGGSYVGPSGRGEWAGPPTIVASSPASHDRDAQRTVWALCEGLTGATSGLPSS